MLTLYFLFSNMGNGNESKTLEQNFTEINEFCMAKKDFLSWYKSQQKLLDIILRFNWKVNEFQWTQLSKSTDQKSRVSPVSWPNRTTSRTLLQRKRYPELPGMQDWKKLWKRCIDDAITVSFSQCEAGLWLTSLPSLKSYAFMKKGAQVEWSIQHLVTAAEQ